MELYDHLLFFHPPRQIHHHLCIDSALNFRTIKVRPGHRSTLANCWITSNNLCRLALLVTHSFDNESFLDLRVSFSSGRTTRARRHMLVCKGPPLFFRLKRPLVIALFKTSGVDRRNHHAEKGTLTVALKSPVPEGDRQKLFGRYFLCPHILCPQSIFPLLTFCVCGRRK